MSKSDQPRFEFRSGNGGLWGGMRSEGDPASNPAFRPRMLVNVDVQGGEISTRPGLTKLFSSPLTGSGACVRNITSLTSPRPHKLWMVTAGCPGISSSAGWSLNHLDPDQDPEFQRAVYYDSSTNQITVGVFASHLYVGTDSDLRQLRLIRQPWGIENLAVSGATQDTPMRWTDDTATFEGYTVSCLLESPVDGMLFIGLRNNSVSTNSKVVTWDGVSFRDDKTGIDPPTSFALYRVQNGGEAVVMGTSGSNTLYIRPVGESPGTWSSIGTVAAAQMLSWRDAVYIATGSAALYKWDGATLASARSPSGSTAMRCLTSTTDFLFFGYETATAAIIGKLAADGTWTDIEKNLTTQFSGTTNVRAVAIYRGYLIAAGTRSSAGRLWSAPKGSTSGSWTEIVPNALSNGSVFQLLVE